MRVAPLLAFGIATATGASAAAAQSAFEGVITATAYAEGQGTEVVFRVKGGKIRMELIEDGDRGILIADGTGSVISVDDAERVYYRVPPPPDRGPELPDLVRLGRSETVAGHRCEYFRYPLSAEDGEAVDVCIATGLGFMGWIRAELSSPAEERRLRRQFPAGAVILKAVEPGGAVAFLVAKIERTRLSDALFAPPAGYREVRLPGSE